MAWQDLFAQSAEQIGKDFTDGISRWIDAEVDQRTTVPDPSKTQVSKPYPDAPAVSRGAAVSSVGIGGLTWLQLGAIAVAVGGLVLLSRLAR